MLQTGLANAKGGIKIGTLLVKAGVVAPDSLALALQTSRIQDRPVGSVLVKLAKLRQKDLSSALYLQSLVNEGILSVKLAIQALNRCHTADIDAQTSLVQLNWQPQVEQKLDVICELMLNSGFINQRLLDDAAAGQEMVTGFSFVMRGVVSCAQFNEVLHAASLVQQHVVTMNDAAEALQSVRKNCIPVTEAFAQKSIFIKADAPRIGSLMVAAGVIGETDLLRAVEHSLRTEQRLGTYLVGSGALNGLAMQACLDAQTLLASGVIEREQAVNLIKMAIDSSKTIHQITKTTGVLREDEARAAAVIRMLRSAEVVTAEQLDQLEAISEEMNCGMVAALAMRGYINKQMYKAAWAALIALEKCELRVEEAIVILQVCSRLNCSFREGLLQVALRQEEKQAHKLETPTEPFRPHMEILAAEKAAKKQKKAQRRNIFVACLIGGLLALCLVHLLVPSLGVEALCAAFGLWLAGCLAKLINWEKEDIEQVENANLTVSVARRTTTQLKKVC